MVTGGECRKARHEQHQGDADHDKPRHDLVVLHRLAGMWPRCPRVVDGILRALHRYSSLGIPTPAKHGLTSTVELPGTVVGKKTSRIRDVTARAGNTRFGARPPDARHCGRPLITVTRVGLEARTDRVV